MTFDARSLAPLIDHTLLRPTAVREDIVRLCDQAVQFGFCAVCINPRWVDLAADRVRGSGVKVATVVGFPLGGDSTKIKLAAIHEAIFAGADEVDAVTDLGAICDADSSYLLAQTKAMVRICRSVRPSVVLKLIIESAALTAEQKVMACEIAQKAGVDFIKTSTGLHPAGGATADDVRLIKRTAPACRVKASGGVKTLEQALALADAGADRIGTSSGVEILQGVLG